MGSPIFKHVRITREDGRRLDILAPGTSATSARVQEVEINGVRIRGAVVLDDALRPPAGNCELHFVMESDAEGSAGGSDAEVLKSGADAGSVAAAAGGGVRAAGARAMEGDTGAAAAGDAFPGSGATAVSGNGEENAAVEALRSEIIHSQGNLFHLSSLACCT